MHAYVFPGQGAQFVGMGKDLYDNVPLAKELFEKANEILGFPITDIMVRRNRRTAQADESNPAGDLPALGHPGQIARRGLQTRNDGRTLAGRIQRAGSRRSPEFRRRPEPGFETVRWRCRKPANRIRRRWPPSSACPTPRSEEICSAIDGVVVPANYNCPGSVGNIGQQRSDSTPACAKLTEAGAKRALKLNGRRSSSTRR